MPTESTESGPTGGVVPPGARPRIPDCPLARTVATIGAWWTLEILHEIFDGHTRFAAIATNLGTPAAVLTERLGDLVAKGLLVPTADAPASPAEREYRLTELGRSLRPVLLVLAAWGNHRLAPDERSLVLVDAETGVPAEPIVVDRETGRRLDTTGHVFAQGPRASAAIQARYPRIPSRD